MTEPLSPAAQAIYDAYCKEADNPYYYERSGLVAALRAAADQLVPIKEEPAEPPSYGIGYEPTEYVQDWNRWHVRRQLRYKLLAIAAELEGVE